MNEVLFKSQLKHLEISKKTFPILVLSDYKMVIPIKNIQQAFDFSSQTDWISDYIASFEKYNIVPTALLTKIRNPEIFKLSKASGYPTIEEGYTIQTLLELCHFLQEAKQTGYINVLELKIAHTAKLILDADNAKSLLQQAQVLSGFELYKSKRKQELVQFLTDQTKDISLHWIMLLPDSLWESILESLNLSWTDFKKQRHPIADFIYNRIWRFLPSDLISNLQTSKPPRSYSRKSGAAQQIPNEPLRVHLSVTELFLKSSPDLAQFDRLIQQTFPNPHRKPIVFDPIENEKPLSPFDLQVKRLLKS